MTRECEVCGEPIPAERLEALPDTQTCIRHGVTSKRLGFMIPTAAKGTAPVLIQVDPRDAEAKRQAVRANRRSR